MLSGSVRWSVDTRTEQPASTAARTFSSNDDAPSEKFVCV